MRLRYANAKDVPALVGLSAAKRARCAEVLPRFWHVADEADAKQTRWFEYLLDQEDHVALVAEDDVRIRGFVIAHVVDAPPVYDPGGKAARVDDFCVEDEVAWSDVGAALLQELVRVTETLGVRVLMVLSAHHDEAKRAMLDAQGCSPASEWLVRNVGDLDRG